MAVTIETLAEPMRVTFEEMLDGMPAPREIHEILKLFVISEGYQSREVPSGNKRSVQIPSIVRACVIRAFDGKGDRSIGEVILEEPNSQIFVVGDSTSPSPRLDRENQSITFALNETNPFQMLMEEVSQNTFLVHAIIRYL